MHPRAILPGPALLVPVAALLLLGPLVVLPHSNVEPQRLGGLAAAVSQTNSLNWAGYADVAPANSVTFASAAWVQPAVKCPSKGTLYAALWVGIDGYNSNTVEQTGTLAVCSRGTAAYVAWWELFPLNAIQTISSVTVHSGDSIKASVTNSSSGFTIAISDVTTGHSFSTTGTQSNVKRSSAECIAERPTVGNSLARLANFGTATFSSCTATIGGTTAGIGGYGTVAKITMVNSQGQVLAAPSSLLNSGQTFSVTWFRSK